MDDASVLIHIPTLVILNITAGATLAFSVGWVARLQDKDGLQLWTGALVLYTVSFVLLALRNQVPDLWAILAVNVAVSGTNALMLAAVGQLQQRRIAAALLWGPPLLLAGALGLALSNLPVRVSVAGLTFAAQLVMIMVALAGGKDSVSGRGRQLMFFGLAIMIAGHLMRVGGVAVGAQASADFMPEAPLRALVLLLAFVSLILVSLGFVLMTKELADERTRLMAMKDCLTGIWNRLRLEDAARAEMARFQRHGRPVSLIMADLDHFKWINDKYGHATGDQVLKGFTAVAQSCIRRNDLLGRWGGAEFVLLLPESGLAEAAALAQRIGDALERHAFAAGIRITASFGVSSCRTNDSWDSWLHRADLALYSAKAAGRNRVESESSPSDTDQTEYPGANFVQLIWSSAYESDNARVDAQHRALFERSNDLFRAILDNRSRAQITALINALVDAIRDHFTDEEALLRLIAYSDTEHHCALHRGLLVRAEELAGRFAQNRLVVGEVFQYLAEELVARHILIEDRKYFRLLDTAAVRNGLPWKEQ